MSRVSDLLGTPPLPRPAPRAIPAPITIEGRRIYILPTREGLLFALVLLAMLVGATNYGSSLAYGLVFLFGSVGLVSLFYTYRNLRGLVVHPVRCAPVFAGATAILQIPLEERDGLARWGVTVRAGTEPACALDLEGGAVGQADLAHYAPRRGRMALPPLRVESRFPLGIFRAWFSVDASAHCLVYPAPAPAAGLPPGSVGEDARGQRQGRGHDDFDALRAYHPGDPLRHVHWKAAARGLDLLVKQFGGERTHEFWLDWGQLGGMGKEARLARLCRWILEAEAAGVAYGLALPPGCSPGVPASGQIAPDRGEPHRRRCLEALARYGEPP